MKKFVCGLFATLLIIYHIIPFIFTKATSVTIPIDSGSMSMPLINSLFAGYEYDFSDTSYTGIDDFMTYLYETGYIGSGVYGSYKYNGITQRQWEDYEHLYYEYIMNNQNQAEYEYELDQLIGKKIRYDMSDLQAFLHNSIYNISDFSNVAVTDIQVPNPDPDYISYLDTLNGHGNNQFYWYNGGGQLGSNYPTIGFFGNPSDYSWCYIYGSNAGTANNRIVYTEYNGSSSRNGYYIYPLPISSIYITSNSNGYSVNFTSEIVPGLFGSASYGDTGTRRNGGTFEYDNGSQSWLGGYSDANQTSITYSDNGTLDHVLSTLCSYFRNVTIYVDDVLWIYAGGTASDVIINTPDIIDNQDLPVPVLPVYDIDHPTPAYIDIGKVLEAAHDAIINHDVLDIDKVIDSGAITDEEGNPVQVIPTYYDPTIETPEELEKTDPLPILPIPKFDLTPENESTSILAQWIHGIDMIMPDELMTIFWGIILGLILLGIIHVLNK